jgi:SNF2 family DNA or RNA helicase
MGLGKTVQALALLESRRAEGAGPSLVVVPNSLVFNWQQEAARFAPQLRVLVHAGVKRRRDTAHYRDYDLVITTYGTLRRDAPALAKVEFDYVILDEAQAIKNANTDSASAARLLRAVSPGDERHTSGESARRAVEPSRLSQPWDAGVCDGLWHACEAADGCWHR